ncbi:hypothetical protein BD413DRAFT_555181 [Trametes elegans]|nr:hypothetical protein BD413DRAFT_555181 [Trametes elegans]
MRGRRGLIATALSRRSRSGRAHLASAASACADAERDRSHASFPNRPSLTSSRLLPLFLPAKRPPAWARVGALALRSQTDLSAQSGVRILGRTAAPADPLGESVRSREQVLSQAPSPLWPAREISLRTRKTGLASQNGAAPSQSRDRLRFQLGTSGFEREGRSELGNDVDRPPAR